MRVALLAALVACGACTPAPVKPEPPAPTSTTSDDDRLARMTAELQDDILGGYERDEPPEIESGMVQTAVGGARIGVGPNDVLIGDELRRAGRRWPLEVPHALRTQVRSKRLETHLSADLSAAWAVDEVSWRIPMCNRTAVIPLRMTSLYAHDGDRWVPVFEHLSFGHAVQPRGDGKLYGAKIKSTSGSDLTDALSRVLQTGLFRPAARDAAMIASGAESVVLGPGIDAEAHGLDAVAATLVPGALRSEDRRVGTIGRLPSRATVAYWIGNVVTDLPARPGVAGGKVRLRGTFVFEQRKYDETLPRCGLEGAHCRWVLVQAHVSEPIDDDELALSVFGTALISTKPLDVTCDDGTRSPPAALQEGPARTAPP